MKKIGLMIERHWHYGRRICEGVAAFARESEGLSLEFLKWEDLKDVAARAGFSSKAYFTAAFNAATGQTPLKWRLDAPTANGVQSTQDT